MMIEAERDSRDAGADHPPPEPQADAPAPPLDIVALYDAHAPRVWRTALALGVARADLDDAVQDVFIVLHRRAREFAGRADVTTWIYAITRRVAADHRRRARRKPAAAELVDVAAPHDERARHDASVDLLALLERLPIEQREVFVLIELEGMTAPEVAALTDAPVNTVSSRLRLARRTLNDIALAARAADGEKP